MINVSNNMRFSSIIFLCKTHLKEFKTKILVHSNGVKNQMETQIALIGLLLLIVIIPVLIRVTIMQRLKLSDFNDHLDTIEVQKEKKALEKEIHLLDRKIKNKTPKSYYLIINSSSNEFTLKKGQTVIKTDKCSTGSYVLLKNSNEQEWMFKTPKGDFWIQGKTTNPVWKKPDWAFVEDGIPVPTSNHFSRFEYGVLGDYALSLGHGYLIHGTLYQRLLGLPVTHGCIRLNDENLELVYNSLSIGSKVYIY